MQRRLQDVSLVLLGLLAGAMLLIALSFLRIWQGLAPAAFLDVFAAHAAHIGALMVPLGAATVVATAASAAATWRAGGAARAWSLLAASASLALGALYPLLFTELNAAFVARSIAASEVPAALARWGFWHWVRTALGLVAFAAQLAALRSGRR